MARDKELSFDDLQQMRMDLDREIEARGGAKDQDNSDGPRSYADREEAPRGERGGLVRGALIPVQVNMGRDKNMRIYVQVDPAVLRSQRSLDRAIEEIERMNRDFEVKMWEPKPRTDYNSSQRNGYRSNGGGYGGGDRGHYDRDRGGRDRY